MNYRPLISLVITSCGRFDLLEKTIISFFNTNTYENISQIILIDDSGYPEAKDIIEKMFVNLMGLIDIKMIFNKKNIGQVRSIDLAYSHVYNPYIFHLEDDWEFYQEGYIERSLEILELYPWIVTVWLRAHDDTYTHPIENISGLPFNLLRLNHLDMWHGFTWNPGLRRLSDYRLIGEYSSNLSSESEVGKWYMHKGYRAAITNETRGYVKHIGWSRSTEFMNGTNKG